MPFSDLFNRKKGKGKVKNPSENPPETTHNLAEPLPFGLLELAKGVNPIVDIVAVHGLNGHREKTWTSKDGVNWLKDPKLLPAILSSARIFSWGYDANTHSKSHVTVQYLYDHATTLVSDLSLERQLTDTERRPIIFIAHSLGGIVVKSALIHSDSARKGHLEAQRAIKLSTYGLFFLGTPHQGGEGVTWGTTLLNVASIFVETNKTLLPRLQRDSEWLQQQLQQYAAISNEFVTKFAYESYPTTIALGKSLVVVPKSSAIVPGAVDAESIAIMADHINMVKFSSAEDNGFRKVSGHLQLMVKGCAAKIETNQDNKITEEVLLGSEKSSFFIPFDLTGVPITAKFVGRDSEISQLQYLLPSAEPKRRKVCVLNGLGGIGKTQLAIEFARSYQSNFTSVFWLNGKSRSVLVRSLAFIAEKLPHVRKGKTSVEDVKNSETAEKKAREVLDWFALEGNSQWLLIFDNIDKDYDSRIEDEEAYNVESFFPGTDQGSIIITTRLKRLEELGKSLRIGILSPEETLEILAERLGRTLLQDEDSNWNSDARDLVKKLDGLPLAVVLAGSYISRTGMSVSKYLQLYTKSWRDLQGSARPPHHYLNGTIETTWTISYEEIKKTDESAAKLLQLLACFDNHDIWFGLLERGIDYQAPEWLRQIVSSEVKFYSAMETLLNYSLIEAESVGNYSMHPVVQGWCREYLNHNQSDEFTLLALLSVCKAVPSSDEPQYWVLQQRLLPHANQIVNFSQGEFCCGDYPLELICDSFFSLGNFYSDQGRLAEAEVVYQRALAGYEKVLGPDHPLTLGTVGSLGNLYLYPKERVLVNLEETEAAYQRALVGLEKAFGPDHRSTLIMLTNLGIVNVLQGRLVKAEVMYQQALVGFEKALGPDHILTLRTVGYLGYLYTEQGRLAKAEVLHQRVLAGLEKAFGPEHTSTLGATGNLSNLYSKQGRLAEAEVLHQQVLAGYEKALGPEHKSTLRAVNNLGKLYFNQGKLAEAEVLHQRALAGYEKALGPEHKSTLLVVKNLGKLYFYQGKLAEAEVLHQRALAGYEKALGPVHKSTLRAAISLGKLYFNQGRLAEAEALYKQLLVRFENALGPEHMSTLGAAENLGILYPNQGRPAKAEVIHQRALAGFEKVLGPEHTSTLLAAGNLGDLYSKLGNLVKAEAMYQRAQVGFEKTLGSDHPLTLWACNQLDILTRNSGARGGSTISLVIP